MKLLEKILVATNFEHASEDALRMSLFSGKRIPLGDHPHSRGP